MKNGSIEAIIGDIIRRLETVKPHHGDIAAGDVFSDLEAFAGADPVLSSLHKEYLEALKCHNLLFQQNGINDPMTEVAADMLDSARSAVQTRLIELQDIREAETRTLMKRRLRSQKAREEAAFMRLLVQKRRKRKDDDVLFWFVMLYWFMMQTLNATRKTLSAANDFALVSTKQEQRTSYAG